jgi:hypothetical protein
MPWVMWAGEASKVMEVQVLDADNFVWNDGGRAASGFVGTTGDCVTRAISIATGRAYKEVYEAIFSASGATPRNGVATVVFDQYLTDRGWQRTDFPSTPFNVNRLPKGVVIVRLSNSSKRSGHLSCVIDRVIHDTWNPADDVYNLISIWIHPSFAAEGTAPILAPKRKPSHEQELTQAEFDKVLRRLRALDRTAKNEASTEAERQNALRAIQTLMLQNNLSREDIREDDNVAGVSFARIACYVNGVRKCRWESSLATYVCSDVFTSVQVYTSTGGKRSQLVFYGPIQDVRNAIQLFRELLLTIATAAKLKYGGYARGSGASYCEGYVRGLPRGGELDASTAGEVVSANALIQTRMLAMRKSATDWLSEECGISLRNVSSSGRYGYDPVAASHGKVDGASHKIEKPDAIKRIERK